MTLHIHYEHQCPNCAAYYVPYDEDVPCPCCGLVEEERFDFVPQAAASAHFNLETQGSYIPTAWWVGSLGDHILHLLFPLLERNRTESTGQAFSDMARKALNQMNWGDQPYLCEHIHEIAVRVFEELSAA